MSRFGDSLRRQVIALVAAGSIASAGLPSVFAASPIAANGRVSAPTDAAVEIQKMRERAALLSKSPFPAVAARGRHIQLWVDIITAKTQTERHKKVKQLPVTVLRSKTADGSSVTHFVARGKVRVRISVPATAFSEAFTRTEQPQSGPAVVAEHDDCYGGEPEPCATQEEMDDFNTYLADTEAELDSEQADFDSNYAEYVAYCDENPWACEEEGLVIEHGPSVPSLLPSFGTAASEMNGACGQYAFWATVGMASTIGTMLGLRGMAADAAANGTTLSSATVTGGYLVLGAAAAGTGYYIGSFIACKIYKLAGFEAQDPPTLEPVFIRD